MYEREKYDTTDYKALFVYAVQRFIELPTYTEVNPGEDALLKCRISDKKGVCSWQKDNKPVGIYRGKYEWANENSPVGGDCSLWVRAATLQLDDGQWQCQVTASNYDVQDALSSPPAPLAVSSSPAISAHSIQRLSHNARTEHHGAGWLQSYCGLRSEIRQPASLYRVVFRKRTTNSLESDQCFGGRTAESVGVPVRPGAGSNQVSPWTAAGVSRPPPILPVAILQGFVHHARCY
ncbi:hypothetical protein ACJJTC_004815, partial [Scirpophaga incertulas]